MIALVANLPFQSAPLQAVQRLRAMTAIAAKQNLQPIPGFESSDYAMREGQLVWTGAQPCTDHPRNLMRPWNPKPLVCDAANLRECARTCLALMGTVGGGAEPAAMNEFPIEIDGASEGWRKGLLPWLTGAPLQFPLNHAAVRFDAIRTALQHNDLPAFATAAQRVIGLGPGLTPSGDDFLGGICFALHFAPRAAWAAQLPAVLADIRHCAQTATNQISAALLDDLMRAHSYRALHDMMAALQARAPAAISGALQDLLNLGASSGADMLAGVLLTLISTPSSDCSQAP